MRRLVFLLGLVLAVVGAAGPARAQEGGRYYPETGHTLDGRFVDFFDSHGGLRILGYPITSVFVDPQTGYQIQYFENARLELVPDRDSGQLRVNASPLGELLGGWGPEIDTSQWPFGSSAGCRFYPDSGHNVCHAFLAFYERNGGPALFGFPISEFKLENDRIVQYFQGFRLDWYPDAPQGPQVQVAPLGLTHFKAMGYPPEVMKPEASSNQLGHHVVGLHVSASVGRPVVRAGDSEAIYVLVRDQTMLPVEGASVTIFLDSPSGEQTVIMPPTDARGVSQLLIPIAGAAPGTFVTLDFSVVFDGLISRARDAFLIWW